MSNPEDMPPWLALPAEVRKAVVERYKTLYGELSGLDDATADDALADMSKYRLVKNFGSIRKAMAFARTRDYPPGPHRREEWEAALKRVTKRLTLFRDPSTREHVMGRRIDELVREELAKWREPL